MLVCSVCFDCLVLVQVGRLKMDDATMAERGLYINRSTLAAPKRGLWGMFVPVLELGCVTAPVNVPRRC